MEKCLSIVLSSDAKNYRKVAQVHWGLTDAQMKDKHVHHHPAVSEGGRNVPEHLYVCSPSMHAHGWHSGEYFIEQAAIGSAMGAAKGGRLGGRSGGLIGGKRVHELHPEKMKKAQEKGRERTREMYPDLAKRAAEKSREKTCKPVLCVETGIVYDSAREACRSTGIPYATIGRCCLGQNKTSGGYHWQFTGDSGG